MHFFYYSAERRAPPLSLNVKAQSSSDYESIPSYDPKSPKTVATLEGRKTPMLALLKANTSSDYESIQSLDLDVERYNAAAAAEGGSSGVPLRILQENPGPASNNSSHDYETIDCFAVTQTIDLESPDSPPFIPDITMRNKFLKVDSEGYASVLFPHEEDENESWEFDCLNQERYRNKSVSSTASSVTVKNVEEAWKHQLEKGYAPLTLQREPLPPVFSRTRSAPNTSPMQEPQDYEVPIHLLTQAVPPPLQLAMKRISLSKQSAQELSSPEAMKVLSGVPEEATQEELAQKRQQAEMHSRVMTAPSTSFKSFKSD